MMSNDPSNVNVIVTLSSMSGVAGICSGYAVQYIGKQVAFWIGVLFLCIQFLVYRGYVTTNLTKVQDDIVDIVDQNDDDTFDVQDVNIITKNMMGIISVGIPSLAGFSFGFYTGLKLL